MCEIVYAPYLGTVYFFEDASLYVVCWKLGAVVMPGLELDLIWYQTFTRPC